MGYPVPALRFIPDMMLCIAFQTVLAWLAPQNNAVMPEAGSAVLWFGVLELPFLFLCVFFAFLTAAALRGGRFGPGMNLLAWGFLVMAVGHLHMQISQYFGVNLFDSLFGPAGGAVAWYIALVVTWGLSGLGFYQLYKASR